jgi:hypothetical protein
MRDREAEPERVARYIDRVAAHLPMPRDKHRLAILGNQIAAIARSLRGYDLDVIDRAAEATITGNALFPTPKQACEYLNSAVTALADERELRAKEARLEASMASAEARNTELVSVRTTDLRMLNRARAWAAHLGDDALHEALRDRTATSVLVPRGWLLQPPPSKPVSEILAEGTQ